MRKYTQRELKALAREGYAQDITQYSFEDMRDFLHSRSLDRVGVSRGTYGMNGGLLQDVNTGEQFVITARNSARFMAF